MNTRKLLATGLLAATMLLSTTSLASPHIEADGERLKISFADLNIHSSAGARVLYGRLQQASADACGFSSYRVLGSLERVAKTKECFEDALDELVSKIDSVELKKIHAG